MTAVVQAIDQDFTEFFLTETTVLNIELPNGEPMLFKGAQVTAHIHGPATTRFTKAKEALDREAMKRVMSTVAKGRKKDEEDRDADVKFLVAITDRIDNFPFPGGVEAIYREPRLKYIADQVRTHVGDLGNFFQAGSTA